jgi:hypothetical protein
MMSEEERLAISIKDLIELKVEKLDVKLDAINIKVAEVHGRLSEKDKDIENNFDGIVKSVKMIADEISKMKQDDIRTKERTRILWALSSLGVFLGSIALGINSDVFMRVLKFFV